MGLASGKSKLELIDIDTSQSRGSATRQSPTLGAGQPRQPSEAFVDGTEAVEQDNTTEIGATLRRARERSGQSLADASRNLRIRMAYLAALENGDFKTLPGMTYAIGYVRTYAQYLDLDVEKAIVLFKAEASDLNGPRQLVFPSPAPEGKVPGGALMFVAAFLAIFAYAGWYHVTDSGRAVAGYSLEVPEVLQSWLDEPSTGAASDGFTTAAIAASPPATNEASPVPSISVPLSETTVLTIAPTHEPKPLAATPPLTSVGTGGNSSVEGAEVSGQGVIEVSETASPEPGSATNSTTATAQAPASVTPGETAFPVVNVTSEGETNAPAPSPVVVAALPVDGDEVPDLASNSPPAPVPAVSSEANGVGESQATPESDIRQSPSATALEISIPPAPDMAQATRPAGSLPPETTVSAKASRVVIKASAASWVQVRASDSTTIMTKVMRAGDVYEVPDRQGLRLFTGNAGALTILVDGKAVRPIGGTGDVARDIDLTPDSLEKHVN